MRAYGINARVVDVSKIKRMSAANDWDFCYKNECVNTVQSTYHVVLCLFYHILSYFSFSKLSILCFQSAKMTGYAATHLEITSWIERKHRRLSRTVSKIYNEDKLRIWGNTVITRSLPFLFRIYNWREKVSEFFMSEMAGLKKLKQSDKIAPMKTASRNSSLLAFFPSSVVL